MPAKVVPVGDSGDGSNADDGAFWADLVANQLTTTRKTAESWRNGSIGILGLVGISSVFNDPATLSGLADWARWTVAVLLAVGVASAVVGLTLSMRAAYGEPKIMTLAAFRQLGGAGGYRLENARLATIALRKGQRWTVVSLALIAVATGLTWFGPRADSSDIEVTDRTGTRVCGSLVDSSDGELHIDTGTGDLVVVNLSEVLRLATVEGCP